MKPTGKRALVPELRFPEFRDAGEWVSEFGDGLFDQITNKDHNSDLPVLAITQEQGAIPRDLIGYHVSVTEKSIESYKIVEIGDFIISLRSFQGGIEYSNYKGICSPAYVVLRLKNEHSVDYFKHFLKTSRFIALLTKNLEGLRDGKMVSYKQFSELQLPTPSRKEQQKIADCLSSLDELISLEAQRLDALKAHKKGMMQQLFPGEGETVPRLRFPEFRDAGEWEEKEIGAVFTFRQGYQVPVEQQYPVSNSNRERFIRIIDITQQNEPPRYIDTPQNANILCKSDLFMVRYGTPGVVAYGYEGVLANNLFQLVFNNGQTHNPSFWYQQLKLKENEISGLSGSSSMPAISFKALNYVFVKFPSLPEQSRIADCLSSLDGLITAQTDRLAALKTHKKGLMQQLFPAMDREEIARGDAEGAEDR